MSPSPLAAGCPLLLSPSACSPMTVISSGDAAAQPPAPRSPGPDTAAGPPEWVSGTGTLALAAPQPPCPSWQGSSAQDAARSTTTLLTYRADGSTQPRAVRKTPLPGVKCGGPLHAKSFESVSGRPRRPSCEIKIPPEGDTKTGSGSQAAAAPLLRPRSPGGTEDVPGPRVGLGARLGTANALSSRLYPGRADGRWGGLSGPGTAGAQCHVFTAGCPARRVSVERPQKWLWPRDGVLGLWGWPPGLGVGGPAGAAARLTVIPVAAEVHLDGQGAVGARLVLAAVIWGRDAVGSTGDQESVMG